MIGGARIGAAAGFGSAAEPEEEGFIARRTVTTSASRVARAVA